MITVLYEDSQRGRAEFALHRLVLRLVEDDVGGETWRLGQRVQAVPRSGVDKVLRDLRERADLIAGSGFVFALVDRDEIVAHLNRHRAGPLPRDVDDETLEAAIQESSNRPDRVRAFFLRPNLEGVLLHIQACAPGRWTADLARACAKRPGLIERDRVFKALAPAAERAVRDCVRRDQPGLEALARAVAAHLVPE